MKRYDRQQIMKRAWSIYRSSFCPISFGEALKEAWKREKKEVAIRESMEQPKDRKASDYRLVRAYSGCRFGCNDWARDYRNDVRAAVRRSLANH